MSAPIWNAWGDDSLTFSQNRRYISIVLNVKASVLEPYSWHAILQTQRKGDAVDSSWGPYVETEIQQSRSMFTINDNPVIVGEKTNWIWGQQKKWQRCDRWPHICLLKCLPWCQFNSVKIYWQTVDVDSVLLTLIAQWSPRKKLQSKASPQRLLAFYCLLSATFYNRLNGGDRSKSHFSCGLSFCLSRFACVSMYVCVLKNLKSAWHSPTRI